MRFFDTRLGRCATLLALGGGVALYAQGTQTASATVTVVDKSGAPVANARVRLTSPSMMAERTGATNPSGVFTARLLPPGTYTIEVIKDGFQTTKDTRAIGMDQHYQPKIVLQPVGNTTVVVMASSMTAVDPTDVKSATNYDAKRIDTLPTGRGIDAIASLTPGVVTSNSVGGRLQVRGAMTSSNLFLVDGQNLMDNTYNDLQYPIMSDSIDEMQVITGAISAEYGNVDGGVINTLTKSGGNEYSGQLRLNFRSPKWNAVRPYLDREGIASDINKDWNLTVGGYILKDKLWFSINYLTASSKTNGNIDPEAAVMPDTATPENKALYGGANTIYTNQDKDSRFQVKLTYTINQDQYVVLTYNNSKTSDDKRDYGVGDLKALIPQDNEFQFWNLAWRATWSPNFTTEARIGAKTQCYTGGGDPDGEAPIYNYAEGGGKVDKEKYPNFNNGGGLLYNNGWFNRGDGGDNRDNLTANLKGSYFLNAAGSHEIDFGFDYYRGTREARNELSPYTLDIDTPQLGRYTSQIIYGVSQYDYATPKVVEELAKLGVIVTPGTPIAIGEDVWNMWSVGGNATQTTMGLYVNDKWKINDNLTAMVGVRWDTYSGKATDTGRACSASGISPRLGVTYDLWGDQDLVFKASYCRYNGAVLEEITGATSGVGKSGSLEWEYKGPSGYRPLSDIYNRANYDPSKVSWYENTNIPQTQINPNMKAPTADEIQLSATYSFDFEKWGLGFASLTYVNKKYRNLMDYRIGWNGIIDQHDYDAMLSHEELFVIYWDNEPDAKRDYKGLELQLMYQWQKLNLTGNISWSELMGNYEGEGEDTPASGQGLHVMDYAYMPLRPRNYNPSLPPYGQGEWTKMYEYSDLYPYGYLQGHTPIVMRWQADYTVDLIGGAKAVLGLAYRFDSGYHYSKSRQAPTKLVNENFGKPYQSLEAQTFGERFTQFENHQRRLNAFHSQSYYDLSATAEFPVFTVCGQHVSGFFKMMVFNVFNHQQLISWGTGYEPTSVTGGLDADWVPNDNFGKSESPGYWGAARSLSFSVGLRF